jgi:thiamine kinase-like enzyme
MLKHRDVLNYLVQQNCIEPNHIVNGEVEIIEVPHRNHNFIISCKSGPGFIVKEGIGYEKCKALSNEAVIYKLFQTLPGYKVFQDYLPEFINYDTANNVVIIRLIKEAQTFSNYHEKIGKFPKKLASSLGSALGKLHKLKPDQINSIDKVNVSTLPWVFFIYRPDISSYREMSIGNIQIVRMIQQQQEYAALLDQLGREWVNESLIHFDFRGNNCLVCKEEGPAKSIKLIDWELAVVGDPCWDIASVFSEYLVSWLYSIPFLKDIPINDAIEHARHPLGSIQPAIYSFWTSYLTETGLDKLKSNRKLVKAARYTGARLLQTSIELSRSSNKIGSTALFQLQVGINIMKRPKEAITQLFGIPFIQ